MKMYSYICLTVICTFAFTFVGCTKKSNQKYSFTGEINNVAFNTDDCYAVYKNNILKITGLQRKPEIANIVIQMTAEEPGTYICNTSDFGGESNFAEYITKVPMSKDAKLYVTDGIHTGIVKITLLDEDNETVSGTFTFQAIQIYHGSDSVDVKGAFENVPIDNDLKRFSR